MLCFWHNNICRLLKVINVISCYTKSISQSAKSSSHSHFKQGCATKQKTSEHDAKKAKRQRNQSKNLDVRKRSFLALTVAFYNCGWWPIVLAS